MVFHASKLPVDFKFNFPESNFEEIVIPTFDGCTLHALLFKSNPSKGVVLYLHGNAGTLERWGNSASVFTQNNYDVLFVDYRGFGKSTGEIEDQTQFLRDMDSVYAFVLSRYAENKVVLDGYSIGTGPAAYLASTHHPKLLILQAPYSDFTDFTSGIVPFFPNALKKFSFPTQQYLKKSTCPVRIFHGDADALIAVENSLKLKKHFKSTDSLYILNEQGHLGMNDNNDFQEQLSRILNEN